MYGKVGRVDATPCHLGPVVSYGGLRSAPMAGRLRAGCVHSSRMPVFTLALLPGRAMEAVGL